MAETAISEEKNVPVWQAIVFLTLNARAYAVCASGFADDYLAEQGLLDSPDLQIVTTD